MHQHPIYQQRADRWREYRLAYKGGEDYLDEFIFRHEKERIADFHRRRERAFYPNHIRAVIDTYAAHLYREHIPRNADSDVLEVFWNDIDLLGNTADEFWESVSQLVQRDGRCAVVVDRFDADGGAAMTRAQELEAGRRPYAYTVAAEDIVDWDVDRWGNFHWVVVREVADVDRSWLDEHPGTSHQYRVWTPDEWILYAEVETEEGEENQYREVDRAPHPVGEVPITFIFWGRRDGVEPVSDSAIKDLAPMNRRLTNLYSLIDEQIYQHVFNILATPESTYESLQSTEWSVSGAIPYDDDVSNPPHYIGPDVSQLEAIHQQIEKTERTIRQLSGLGRVNSDAAQSVQTGIALSYLTMDKDALLAKFGQRMERAEASTDRYALRWMELSGAPGRQYPASFDPMSVGEELEAAMRFEGLGIGGEARVENAIQAVRARLGSRVSSARLQEIENDLRNQLDGGTISGTEAPSLQGV